MIPKLKTRIEGHKMMEQHLKQQVRHFYLFIYLFFASKRKNNVRLNKRPEKVQNLVKISQGRKEKQRRKNRTVLNSASNFIKSFFSISDSVHIGVQMAPTIGSASGSRSPSAHRRQQGAGVERSGLVCRVKYTNTLPDIPFDSKSIKYPFSRNRFLEYKPTTLEKLCKVELHTDFDLGVNIDLINPETYIRPPGVELEPDDNALLQDDDSKKNDTKR